LVSTCKSLPDQSAISSPSQLTRLDQFLGAVADAKDVDVVAPDLKEDAVNAPLLAVKELPNFTRVPFAFGSKLASISRSALAVMRSEKAIGSFAFSMQVVLSR
jgi:hypothetical protein